MQNKSSVVIQVEQCLKKYNLTNGQTLLLAYSGGSDSSCLLHILASLQENLGFKLIAAHLDHGWRQASASEAQQCAQTCTNLNVPLIIDHAQNWMAAAGKHRSKEALGRALRQKFLRHMQQLHSASAIITAHHANDQIETFFIRLLRGAGISGLCAMQQLQVPYLRPLLHCDKAAIMKYLEQHNISFINDESNTSPKFLRNRIRSQLIPLISDVDQRARQKILDCISALQQDNDYLDAQAKSTLAMHENQTVIDLVKFKMLPSNLQMRCMVQFLVANKAHFVPSTNFLAQACKFLYNSTKKQHQMGEAWIFYKTKKLGLIRKNALE